MRFRNLKLAVLLLVALVGGTLTMSGVASAAPAPSTPDLIRVDDKGRSPEDNITKTTNPTFVGSKQPGTVVHLFVDGKIAENQKHLDGGNAGSSSYVIQLLGLKDGTYLISARATDLFGNASSFSGSLEVTIDTVAPAKPAPPDLHPDSDSGSSQTDNITNVKRPTFTGTTEPLGRVRLLDADTRSELRSDLRWGQVITEDGSWNITATRDVSEGTRRAITWVDDVAGNSSESDEFPFEIDISPPAAPKNPPSLDEADDTGLKDDGLTNVSEPTFIGNSGDVDSGAPVKLYSGDLEKASGTAEGDGSYRLKSGRLADGTHLFSVTQLDVAGNESSRSAPSTLVVDDPGFNPPELTKTDPPPPANHNAPRIFGAAELNSTVFIFTNPTCDGLPVASGSDSQFATTGFPVAVADNTTTTFYARAQRGVEELTPCSSARTTPGRSITYEEDSLPPTASAPSLTPDTDTGASSSDRITKDASPTFTGPTENGSTVTLFLDGSQAGSHEKTGTTYSISADDLAEGQHSATISIVDAAGNQSTMSPASMITIDVTAPDTNIITAPESETTVNNATFSFSGTDTSATFTCVLDETESSCTSPKTYEGLGDGPHVFRVAATDVAGNTDPSPASFSWTQNAKGLTPRAVALDAGARKIRFGRNVSLLGTLSSADAACAGAGHTVLVSAAPAAGSYAPLRESVTGEDGLFSTGDSPRSNTDYLAAVAENGPCSQAISEAVRVRVMPRIALTTSDVSVRQGDVVKLGGRVAPAHQGSRVVLQRRTDGGWKKVSATALNDSSRYRIGLKAGWTGKRTFRARIARHDDHAAGTSKPVTIRSAART